MLSYVLFSSTIRTTGSLGAAWAAPTTPAPAGAASVHANAATAANARVHPYRISTTSPVAKSLTKGNGTGEGACFLVVRASRAGA